MSIKMKRCLLFILAILVLPFIYACGSGTDKAPQADQVILSNAAAGQQEEPVVMEGTDINTLEDSIIYEGISFTGEPIKLDGINFGEGFRRGINMGNMLEAPSEGAWGVRAEDEYFEIIKNLGFDFVRIPIRWSNHTSDDYTINPDFFSRVDHVIAEAGKNGLGIILNIHHFNEMNTNPERSERNLYRIWTQLAEHYAELPLNVVFEVFNEPNDKLTTNIWNQYQNKCIEIIRETNPDRKILVTAAEWGGAGGIVNLVLPDDPNLIVSFHCYDPFKFTHQGADWTDNANENLGTKWMGTDDEKRDLEQIFKQVRAWSEATGIPVIMGEFGAYEKADMDSRALWTTYMRETAENYGFAWCYWEFCSGFGIYDPLKEEVKYPLVDALISDEAVDYGVRKGSPVINAKREGGMVGPSVAERSVNLICDSWTGMSMYDTDNGTVMVEFNGFDKVTDWAQVFIPLDGMIDNGQEFSHDICELTFRNVDGSTTDFCVNLDNSGDVEAELLWPELEDLINGSSQIIQNDDGTTTFILNLQEAYETLKGKCENGIRVKMFIESVPDRKSNYDRIGSLEFINVELKKN